jgi:hypothetical protein
MHVSTTVTATRIGDVAPGPVHVLPPFRATRVSAIKLSRVCVLPRCVLPAGLGPAATTQDDAGEADEEYK